ncbi:SRPBCC family protein [Microbacterium karelineae]|uniref:SRPBCC family protein n=1 Tax=Microbacterium karelineae TaxID=2654283 RepID=UPI0012EA623D|nr:SRPBCC family protein [Microbacterium karelineae]
MPITSIDTDHETLTTSIVADFAASRQRLWDAYADPRLIEQFWGPETYPATFTRHDMFPGGQSRYSMTGPEGDVAAGYWEFLSVDAPNSFEVLNGFAGEDGEPNRDMPSMRMEFAFEDTGDGSRLTVVTHFNSLEELEQLVEMGMIEGTTSAMSQIDAVLADLRTFAADIPTHMQKLSDTQVRVSRVIRGSVEDVWRAHHDVELLRKWMYGMDGWELTECVPPAGKGSSTRYRWVPGEGVDGEAFSIIGDVLDSDAPHRLVHTEQMEGYPGTTINELTLTAVPEGTLLVYVMTYESAEVRDQILATGMTDGMELSYQRLDGVLA